MTLFVILNLRIFIQILPIAMDVFVAMAALSIDLNFYFGLIIFGTMLIYLVIAIIGTEYSNFRKYAHPLDVKGGIITEKVLPVFSESFFWTCFGLVMYIWVLMDVTEKLAFQM